MVTLFDDLTGRLSNSSLPHTGGGIVIDIGTGDGRFVYQSARRNPDKFYIGIDPSTRPLAKISQKVRRRPEKGGLANVLFIQAAIEDLPSDLDGVADEVHIHFPWGSLLRAVAVGEKAALSNIRRICSCDALLEVVMALDAERDQSEIQRLGIEPVTSEYLKTTLAARYRAAGFEVSEAEVCSSDWPGLKTSWAARLRGRGGRPLAYLIARAAG